MKTIGLIGGMSWESTTLYYEIINKVVSEKLGGLHSAKILLYSVDFAEIEELQRKGQWNKSADILAEIAMNLEVAGADFILICTNTMHKVAGKVQGKINIPILHIAEATVAKLKENKISKVLLLGTKYTMTEDFYKGKLKAKGIDVVVPNEEDIEIVNEIIFSELCLGKINEKSKEKYIKIINSYKDRGIEGVILGCTEIGLLINQNDLEIPVFDTTIIHCEQAANYATMK
ncbi:aspartate/glutamate racemase family protein [Miniphocaeibacter halophilus]|uniref:Aspartate/glutamate racemase family protein n=1 Tax=Miniphocaeibacter halophilus TaxID=2931922 RepID=A0AC61MVH4_9FIRM|nr:aspartate/glutamate racemase family protein [Miniphocaeibacter halophilus]QQK08609.1 aspartate/glutamate racemase family protein [Miniphocaeibacter halophilus]